jgi:hypothetical protein
MRVDKQSNVLDQYSLTGSSSELEENVITASFLFDGTVLNGQATAIYAAPNTGKTLITLNFIMNSSVDKSKLYYLNFDDTSEGLVTKLKIAEEYGFHILSDGHKGLNKNDFKEIMLSMVKKDECNGIVIIADTLKKVSDLMNKEKVSKFNDIVRSFISKGGTFVGLAHVNKKLGADGKPVYSGTSDTIDDFDCAYLLHKVSEKDGFHFVQFECIKKRSSINAPLATYRYSSEQGISYNELLLSVDHVEIEGEMPYYEDNESISTTMMIDVVKYYIESLKVNTKMKLAAELAKNLPLSRRKILKFIDDNTGVHWNYKVGEHNTHIFYVCN